MDEFKKALPTEYFRGLIETIDSGQISGKIAKNVFADMIETGKKAEVLIKEKGLVQITDQKVIEEMVDKIILENPKSVNDYKAGKEHALKFLMGQIMKISRGKVNPGLAHEIFSKKLKE